MSAPLADPRRAAVSFLTALFRAAGLTVAVLPLLARRGVPAGADGILLSGLALLAIGCWALRAAVRRNRIAVDGGAMALGLLALVALVSVCIWRTGGLVSPLFLLLAALTLTGALTLAPLYNFVTVAGVSVCACAIALAGAAAPVALLIVQLGTLAGAAFLVNDLRTAA